MADIRPAASLTSSLLARRGDARPAMRRQPLSHLHAPVQPQDDLGWNDIGEDHHRAASVAAPAPPAEPADQSPVARHLDTLAERLAQPAPAAALTPAAVPAPARKPAAAAAAAPRRVARRKPAQLAATAGRKAAFTLRIDAERHLRLRLLSALLNRSSQQLLIEALDSLLAAHDKVEDLAGQVEAGTAPR